MLGRRVGYRKIPSVYRRIPFSCCYGPQQLAVDSYNATHDRSTRAVGLEVAGAKFRGRASEGRVEPRARRPFPDVRRGRAILRYGDVGRQYRR